ncbi:DUF7332 family protein [Halobellus limi]|uniref:Uncharacterized protein n=1 Tax=Halobellus limi TaxID=699433 RepID=A0A1H5SUY5_9EURY|nr:hypothetical protein [Halobellus limi]QCC47480.1 hypothetical protein DV707_07285 [Halobellus limi]SEF54386.1 hypothetical protein SAMN04488133_0087 [Halobellus limi]
MSRRRGTSALARLVVVALVCSLVVAAVPPAAAQSDGDGGGGAAPDADERRCFPAGGHDLTVGDGNPHIDVTVHTSLFTDPSPPSALGLEARGVALDSDVIELRTGVVLDGTPEGISPAAVWDAFAILFDYRLSLPMFSDAVDDSTYEPTGGPVSGVETRGC